MNKKDRQLIFDKYGGRCSYCGDELQKGWHVDHIEPIVRDFEWDKGNGRFKQTGTSRRPENHNTDNYNPSCASCNIQKNSFSLEEFRKNIKNFVNSLNLYNTQYKFAKRYGLVKEVNKEVIFYFETIDNEKHKSNIQK